MNKTDIILEKLNKVYEEKNLSFNEIAQKTGFGKSTVHRYFTGEISKIPVDFIVAFAKMTNTDPMWFIGFSEKEKSEAPTSQSVLTNFEQQVVNLCKVIPEDKREDFIDYLKTAVKMMK